MTIKRLLWGMNVLVITSEVVAVLAARRHRPRASLQAANASDAGWTFMNA